MPLRLIPLTKELVHNFAREAAKLRATAFAKDPWDVSVYPHGATKALLSYVEDDIISKVLDPSSNQMHIVVVDISDELAGFSGTSPPTPICYASLVREEPGRSLEDELKMMEEHVPPDCNPEAYTVLIGEIIREKDRVIGDNGGKPYFGLRILCTAPQARRKGCGTMILEEVKEKCREGGMKCFLNSSPIGLSLYQKMGWKEMGRFASDLDAYLGPAWTERESVNYSMMYDPGVENEEGR